MSGNQYRAVIIPSASILTQTELDRLQAFAKGGGKVLFLGRTPSLISGKTILDARAATPADFAFATVETSAQLPPTPTPPAQAPAAPPTPQVVPEAIETALNNVIAARSVVLDSPDPGPEGEHPPPEGRGRLSVLQRRSTIQRALVTLKAAGKKVEVWDPATGTVSPLASTPVKGGGVTVKFNLKPYETDLIIVR